MHYLGEHRRVGCQARDGGRIVNNPSHHAVKMDFRCLDGAVFMLSGKTAQIMHMLVIRNDGITPFDTWPLTTRLGSTIHQLRRRYGLEICTEMEPHKGGFHARYRLVTSVRLEN